MRCVTIVNKKTNSRVLPWVIIIMADGPGSRSFITGSLLDRISGYFWRHLAIREINWKLFVFVNATSKRKRWMKVLNCLTSLLYVIKGMFRSEKTMCLKGINCDKFLQFEIIFLLLLLLRFSSNTSLHSQTNLFFKIFFCTFLLDNSSTPSLHFRTVRILSKIFFAFSYRLTNRVFFHILYSYLLSFMHVLFPILPLKHLFVFLPSIHIAPLIMALSNWSVFITSVVTIASMRLLGRALHTVSWWLNQSSNGYLSWMPKPLRYIALHSIQ